MGLRSNSRPRRQHKMATDLSPHRESRVKGQGPESLDSSRRQSCRKNPCRGGGGLANPRSGHSERCRWGKERNLAPSGRRFDRPRPHAGAVSLNGTLSAAPVEPFWRDTAR